MKSKDKILIVDSDFHKFVKMKSVELGLPINLTTKELLKKLKGKGGIENNEF